jgi:hypothetical protein
MKSTKRRLDVYAKPLRVMLIVFGATAAASGFYGYFHGNPSYAQYSARVGAVETGNALWFGILGVVVLVIGLATLRKSSK